MSNIIEVLIKSLLDTKGFEDAGAQLDGFAAKGAKTSGGVGKAFEGLIGTFAGVGLAIEGISRTVELVGGAIEKAFAPSIEMENLTVQFEVLLGSAGAAKSRMEELTKFADTTPFQLPEVARASKVLETLTHGALATGKGLTMVGDLASGTGQKFDELAMWVGRLYDGLQSGRPVGEALMRLQELGIMSGDVRGKIENLQAEGKKGDEVWSVAAASFGRYAGMMDKQSKTLSGLLSTLEDAFNSLLRTVFGDAKTGSKGPLQFLIDLLGQLKEPLAGMVRDAESFWGAMYGDDAKSFSQFLSENALPALVALGGTLLDLGKIAAALWEGMLGTGRLAMAGLFQLFQGLYGVINAIPVGMLLSIQKVLEIARSAISALPPSLRPEGADRFLADQQAATQRSLAVARSGFDALGTMSQTFADQAAENFQAAGFAVGEIGKTQGARGALSGPAEAGKSGAASAGAEKKKKGLTPEQTKKAGQFAADNAIMMENQKRLKQADREDTKRWLKEQADLEKSLEADSNRVSNDAFDLQQRQAKAAHEADLQNKLFEARKKQEMALEQQQKQQMAWMVQQTMAFVQPIQNGLQTGIAQFIKTGDAGATKIAESVKNGLIDAAAAFIAKMAMSGLFSLLSGGAGGGLFGGLSSATSGLPSFDVGHPSLPRDMVAMVHAGEAVIPAGAAQAARKGDLGAVGRFLGVQAPAPSAMGHGRLASMDDEVWGALERNGAALVRIHAQAQAGFAGV